MVSSTFTDLKTHRQKVIDAIHALGLKANVMEHQGARSDLDVLDSSLEMVRDAAAYVGVISRKYGQIPVCPKRNPKGLSITELEFDEATRLGRPILLFIMGDKHPVTEADIELKPAKRKKLEAFRKKAKLMSPDSKVHRIYEEFNSLEQLAEKAPIAIANLVKLIEQTEPTADLNPEPAAVAPVTDPLDAEAALPTAPDLRALPRYLGSHKFVGRAHELQTLTDWSAAADPNPMLLFEAMGGSGKSMLTWEWLTNHATTDRTDWAGRFWYSFYERGADMSDFCRQALAYIRGCHAKTFLGRRTSQLAELLLAELERQPWLLVLDGLERILVAYHRYDAAQLRDEQADEARDIILGDRDPRQAIRAEDDELLRRLAAANPSKILVSSRLTPKTLLAKSGIPVPGVKREFLQGLRPPDAEALFRACGVFGNSSAIQDYLRTNCDCHALVIGVLAGLVNDYPPDQGNFDRWAADPQHGRRLNLADLDMTQRRNHILEAAITALDAPSLRLLQTMALLHSGADYDTLVALNPNRPPQPEVPPRATNPATSSLWETMSETLRQRRLSQYEAANAAHERGLQALTAWENDPAVLSAANQLKEVRTNLERRGLLQYDKNARRYDLHPVVRGVASGRMSAAATQDMGQRVVDHFNALPHIPWSQASTLEDLEDGIQVVRTYIRMHKYVDAITSLSNGLIDALIYSIGNGRYCQAMLEPFFPNGWDGDVVDELRFSRSNILNTTAIAFALSDRSSAFSFLDRAIYINIDRDNYYSLAVCIENYADFQDSIQVKSRLLPFLIDLNKISKASVLLFKAKLLAYEINVTMQNREESEKYRSELYEMGTDWGRGAYRQGELEIIRARDAYQNNEDAKELIKDALQKAISDRNSLSIEHGFQMLAAIKAKSGNLEEAVTDLEEALRMARISERDDTALVAQLMHYQFLAGGKSVDESELTRISSQISSQDVAELWLALGRKDLAIEHANKVATWAAADGEPYVRRHALDWARSFLANLGVELAPVPPHNPAAYSEFSWESAVRTLIAEAEEKGDQEEDWR